MVAIVISLVAAVAAFSAAGGIVLIANSIRESDVSPNSDWRTASAIGGAFLAVASGVCWWAVLRCMP